MLKWILLIGFMFIFVYHIYKQIYKIYKKHKKHKTFKMIERKIIGANYNPQNGKIERN